MFNKVKAVGGFVFSWRTGLTAGAVVIAWWIVLASVFGWSGPSTQDKQVAAALTRERAKICAAQFFANPKVAENYAALAAAESYKKTDVLMKTGAQVMPGESADDSSYARKEACVAMIEKTSASKVTAASNSKK